MAVNGHIDNRDAFIAAWLLRNEAGDGVADVLFGSRDFVGKTPYTWCESVNSGCKGVGLIPEPVRVQVIF